MSEENIFCPTCRGRGVRYDYTNSTMHIMPCPNKECRLAAQERSKKEIKRIKNELSKQWEVQHEEVTKVV
ncbi:hypothetical protein HLI_09245 [Halobacillus litoralis]|uniref:Uncharacterized protein n=1 Tax=Halobacillus litoralis TaxID=45668 RepID=A0A410MCL1_9BACI|nr:hypothetical protein HLI_09245 [Halobacillus litoralis]